MLKITGVVAFSIAFALGGCAGEKPPVPAPSPNEFCKIAKPIYFEPADKLTDRTERAIIAHNEKGAALCQWQGAS